MNADLLNQIVEAVLYEGYILYPYRASSKKNKQRFTFGRVYPHAYHLAQEGAEPYVMQTECLLHRTSNDPQFDVSVRFLQPTMRQVTRPVPTLYEWPDVGEPELEFVAELQVDDQLCQTWLECVERQITLSEQKLEGNVHNVPFSFPASRTVEPVRNHAGRIAAVIIRRQEPISGVIEIETEPVDEVITKIRVRLRNDSPISDEALRTENSVLMHTLASAHLVLQTHTDEFVSITDPPATYKAAAMSCQNIGCWPVLVGDETKAERDTILASPIILPDYPEIAPQSAGSLYDGLEIDEILTLRILTMTDEEKHEMRSVDEHARALLERTEALDGEHLMRMHGVMRSPHDDDPFDREIFGGNRHVTNVTVDGASLEAGDVVRIKPKSRADIMDMALAGKTALIESIQQDAEGHVHLALVLEDDPGRDLGMLRQPGHRFFYGLDEIEVVKEAVV